jgi:hypothetical protein
VAAAGLSASLDASATLDASWKPEHVQWVAIAFDKTTYRVLQAVQIDVK